MSVVDARLLADDEACEAGAGRSQPQLPPRWSRTGLSWPRAAALAALALSACLIGTRVRPDADPRGAGLLARLRQAGPGSPPLLTPTCAMVIQTVRDSTDRLTPQPGCAAFRPVGAEGGAGAGAALQLDLTDAGTEQTILGFGGAFTEASALTWQALSPELQHRLLEAYFHPTEGIGYTLGRVHINSCDFASHSYSFDDVPEDFELFHFDDAVSHDKRTLIPFIKAAQSFLGDERPLQLVASPWSPPAWMKHSWMMTGSPRPAGLRPECHSVWARYITRWLDAYARHGVQIWALTPQNEPENTGPWEACVWEAVDMAVWVRETLGPFVKNAQPNVKLLAYDHNRDHMRQWADVTFSDPNNARWFAGMAVHWYAGDHFDAIRDVRTRFPDKVILNTEATYEKHRWPKAADGSPVLPLSGDGEWAFGLGYAHDILGSLTAGSSGWIDWNLLLNERGGPNHANNACDAPAVANISAQELNFHAQYYAIGHFSKFVPPDSTRLVARATAGDGSGLPSAPAGRPYGTCTAADGVQAAAFVRPDGKVATVALNCGDEPRDWRIVDGEVAIDLSIPAQSIQTILHERPTEESLGLMRAQLAESEAAAARRRA